MYTVMIVDDEIEIRDGMRSYFPWNKIGFDVTDVAKSGEEALEKLNRAPTHIVLLDIRMPGMSGLEVARILHERNSPSMVVMLSAYRDFEYARQAMSYGVRHYVLKSIRYQEMIETFEKIKREMDALIELPDVNYKEGVERLLKRYVTEHLREATLEGAAASIGKSISFTSAFFKRQTGMQFGEYMQKQRMERAAELLTDVRLKTFEVSEQVGYATPKSFARTFKKHYGVSPRQWRGQEDED